MDAKTAISVVPVIIGLVVLCRRLGLPPIYETVLLIAISIIISVGYVLATYTPNGPVFADAVLRGVAVGLSCAGLINSVRRLDQARTPARPRTRRGRALRQARAQRALADSADEHGRRRRRPAARRRPRPKARPPIILPGAPPDP